MSGTRTGHRDQRRHEPRRDRLPGESTRFKVSNDPHFEDKLVDVVGLYMNPPERAVVFSFDEKTQVQALDRTQPSLPMKPGRAGTMTHDYKRHGTTDLFAAMNIATGEVLYDTQEAPHRRRRAALLQADRPPRPKGPRDPRRARQPLGPQGATGRQVAGRPETSPLAPAFHPDSSSWLNLVERWFNALTERRLRRGVFTSVAALIEAIETLGRALERRPEALHLAQAGRGDHRQGASRSGGTHPSQMRRATRTGEPETV